MENIDDDFVIKRREMNNLFTSKCHVSQKTGKVISVREKIQEDAAEITSSDVDLSTCLLKLMDMLGNLLDMVNTSEEMITLKTFFSHAAAIHDLAAKERGISPTFPLAIALDWRAFNLVAKDLHALWLMDQLQSYADNCKEC